MRLPGTPGGSQTSQECFTVDYQRTTQMAIVMRCTQEGCNDHNRVQTDLKRICVDCQQVAQTTVQYLSHGQRVNCCGLQEGSNWRAKELYRMQSGCDEPLGSWMKSNRLRWPTRLFQRAQQRYSGQREERQTNSLSITYAVKNPKRDGNN